MRETVYIGRLTKKELFISKEILISDTTLIFPHYLQLVEAT